MKRLSLVLAVPVAMGVVALTAPTHSSPLHTFAAAGTVPPPPSIIPTPIGSPPPPPSPSPTVTSTATATVPVPTATTAAPTATSPPPVATATKPAAPHVVPTMKTTPRPGGGGMYVYSSGSAGGLAPTTLSRNNAGAASLPRTGGGAGKKSPSSPLTPLALLAGLAIAAGRFLPRLVNR